MRKRYINPYTDFGFKKLFGEESSLPFLLDFLNALLKKNIRKLQLKNTEQQASVYGERKAIFDVYC